MQVTQKHKGYLLLDMFGSVRITRQVRTHVLIKYFNKLRQRYKNSSQKMWSKLAGSKLVVKQSPKRTSEILQRQKSHFS